MNTRGNFTTFRSFVKTREREGGRERTGRKGGTLIEGGGSSGRVKTKALSNYRHQRREPPRALALNVSSLRMEKLALWGK